MKLGQTEIRIIMKINFFFFGKKEEENKNKNTIWTVWMFAKTEAKGPS